MIASLGGIVYGGYESAKSTVQGLAHVGKSLYDFQQRVLGAALHLDFEAAVGEYGDALRGFGDHAKEAWAGMKNVATLLGDDESRQILGGFLAEYYGSSAQVTQSELLGKLPMEVLIAAGTAGAGEVISAAGIPQRIGGAINSLADALTAVDVRFPIVLDRTAVNSGGFGSIKGFQPPFVSTTAQLRSLTGISKSAEWITPEQGVPGPGLREHFAKHGSQVNVSTVREYDLSARLTIQNGRSFTYRDRSSNAPRIGYFHEQTGLFTATSNIGKVTHMHTHFPQTWEELRRLPGFSVAD